MKGIEMRLQNIVPVLDVRDVDASIEFYKSALGFIENDKVTWGGHTEWALLRSGQVQIMLCASQEMPSDDEIVQTDNVFYIFIEDMDALEMQLNKAKISSKDRGVDSGQSRDFYVRDPDGYVLWFSPRPLGYNIDKSIVQDTSMMYA